MFAIPSWRWASVIYLNDILSFDHLALNVLPSQKCPFVQFFNLFWDVLSVQKFFRKLFSWPCYWLIIQLLENANRLKNPSPLKHQSNYGTPALSVCRYLHTSLSSVQVLCFFPLLLLWLLSVLKFNIAFALKELFAVKMLLRNS